MKEKNFKDDVAIDRFHLDVECEEHPTNFLFWGEQYANAKAEVNRAKDKLDLMESDREIYYRNHPLEGMKVTEASIKAMLGRDKDIMEAKEKYIEAQHAADTLQAAVRALEHKKSELDNLRHLFIAGYYAQPGGRTATDDMTDAARKGLNRKPEQEEKKDV